MTNAASEKSISRQKALAASDAQDEALVLRNLMRTPSARRWVWLQLAQCSIFSEDGNLDPQYLSFRAGQRSIGLRLLSAVTRTCPQEYVLMTQENTSVNFNQGPQEETDDNDN